MRRYDDPVEVRKGLVSGSQGQVEGPEQFLWKGRLWKVSDVVAHWVETGPWWQSREVAQVLGAEDAPGTASASAPRSAPERTQAAVSAHDLLAEREVWRVEAGRGLAATGTGRGVFDLSFDWTRGSWVLTRALD